MQELPALAIRYSAIPDAAASQLDLAAGPLLQAALGRSLADGIYLYRFERGQLVLDLVSSRGLPATSVQPFQVQAGERTQRWLLSLRHPTQVESSAWRDWRLGPLPEFAHNRFQTAFAIPLTTEGTLAGILTAGRLVSQKFALPEATALLSLQSSLDSLLAITASREDNARLRSELQILTDRLAGRKQIERAKGIIQTRHGWTEEEAYLHLRRLSRKTRKPISEIARAVIVHSTSGLSTEAS
jgi:hypothetical protein